MPQLTKVAELHADTAERVALDPKQDVEPRGQKDETELAKNNRRDQNCTR